MTDNDDKPSGTLDSSFWRKLKARLSRSPDKGLRESLEGAIKIHAAQNPGESFGKEAKSMMLNIIEFSDLRVDDVMVPRVDIVAIEDTASMRELMHRFLEAGHSRLPVYRETLDEITGMVHVKDFLAWMTAKGAKRKKGKSEKPATTGISVSAAELSGPALDAYRTQETQAIVKAYLGLAVALGVVAAVVWAFRNRLKGESHTPASLLAGFELLKRTRFGFGALCIFLYVGAEVSIGSLIVSYLMLPGVMALEAPAAGKLIGFYWGGAMVGRFIGSALLRMVSPGKLLAAVAMGAITLILLSANTGGAVSGYSLLAIGLVNSIMFPTIFSLACERLGARAADGSGIINIAIFGGAVIPLLTGMLADATGRLSLALALPAACYAVIAAFGWYARRPAEA